MTLQQFTERLALASELDCRERAVEHSRLLHEVEHWLYRCYDAAGRLLYIGCTRDVEARLQAHMMSTRSTASAALRDRIATHDVEGPFVGRVAGRAAERVAIEAEAPLLNKQHNRQRVAS